MIKKETDKLKIPLFSKGSLVFEKSGHTLVKSGAYYRCSLQTKGLCKDKNEELIPTKSLVEKLNRTIEKFVLPEGEATKMTDRVFKAFMELGMKSMNREAELQSIIEPTINMIIEDIRDDRKIKRADMSDLKKYFLESIRENYKLLLLSQMMDLVFILSGSDGETNAMKIYASMMLGVDPKMIRGNFARHLKKVYLSSNGKIESIEFEGWSWFCVSYFKSNIFGYPTNTSNGFILNKRKFDTTNILKCLEEFERDNFKNTYSYSSFATAYAEKKLVDKIFGDFEKLDKDTKIKYLCDLNTLSIEFIYAYFVPIFGVK